MILKKICIKVFLLVLLNGCVQNTALLGPVLTVASTGNISQGGISYAATKTIKKVTGKTVKENLENVLTDNEEEK
jgi:hypothetical protein